MSKQIIVTENEVKAALEAAKSQEVKDVLAALFCKPENKPNLDDYKSIKTYEDACEALDLTPIYSDDAAKAVCFHINQHWDYRQDLPKHIIALMKLEVISRALWGRNWEPKPDASGDKWFYYPWFALFTQDEIDKMDDAEFERRALLAGTASSGASAGFGYLLTTARSSYAYAAVGFRLCQETEEKAEYFGRQFINIWAEYLAFNFTVGEPIVKQ
ncbi:MAG: hypothetical protein K6E94_00730 [Elusimicrobiaceae bacterium]|nr:hypothetical protein [Elusimicrobiaceae bacterium]